MNHEDRGEKVKANPNPNPKIVFESELDRNPLAFLGKPWVQKTAFWVLLLAVLIYLRSFFALIFLTFLFSVLMEAVVRRTPNLIPSRRGRVVMVFVLLLSFWAAFFYFMVPRVAGEFKRAVDRLPRLAQGIQRELERLKPEKGQEGNQAPKGAAPPGPHPASEDGEGAGTRREGGAPAGEDRGQGSPEGGRKPGRASGRLDARGAGVPGPAGRKAPKKVERRDQGWDLVIDAVASVIRDALSKEKVMEFVRSQRGAVFGFMPQVVGHLIWAVTVFLLSLIFSFLIVLDFPRLVGGYYKLETTRAGPFFQVARETFSPFGRVLAQALGAQTVIALVNTALTAVGMALLGIPSIEVLSMIVFLCSFIPVAGVFISSAPICIVALGNNGFATMMLFIGVVTVVHMIEAYILNPRIYGAHLRMNPLVVLVLLVLAHHLLGVWGLLLATPVAAYLFHDVLEFPRDEGAGRAPGAGPDAPPA